MSTEKVEPEGWTKHNGKDCPIQDFGLIEVRLRDGRLSFSRFGYWIWNELAPVNIDIIAYRSPDREDLEMAA
ncbi:MAG: hypothetical protein KUG65_06030 [Sphingomonadaceae bacterium]|nr:hypothetical protein [Sphingomonadaceae bacterium]